MKIKKMLGLTGLALGGLASQGLEAEIGRAVEDALAEQATVGSNYLGETAEVSTDYKGKKQIKNLKVILDAYDNQVKTRRYS